MSTFKYLELIGTSPNSIEEAMQSAVADAGKSISEIKWVEIDRINAVTRNLKEGDAEDKEFERRMRVAETLIKDKEIEGKTNANRPRIESPTPTNQPRVSRPMEPNTGTGTQGRGVV